MSGSSASRRSCITTAARSAAITLLARRDYAKTDDREAVDNVLLFVPNETLTVFIHENDPELVDEAMRQNVVICSPLTLFAFLGRNAAQAAEYYSLPPNRVVELGGQINM